MRLLWVKVGGLWPLTAGGRIRSFHIVRELSRRHSVVVLTTHASASEELDVQRNLPDCERLSSFPYSAPKRSSAAFASALAQSWLSPLPVDFWRWRVPELRTATGTALGLRGFDVCVADFLSAVPNLPLRHDVPVVLFEHNVEHTIWRRLSAIAPSWQRPFLAFEWRKVRRYERNACTAVSRTIAVSERDRSALASLATQATVRAIPTGVDIDYFARDGREEQRTRLAFVGSMDWYPNEDAALHFINGILPLVRSEIPETELTIVGRNPSDRLAFAASKADVQITGTVADVRPYLAEAAVLVVPLRIGGGTRLKIFEALAMRKAVVSTTIGAEGLPLVPGKHLIVADDPGTFAQQVVALQRDPARRIALGAAGYALVADTYTWSHAARAFEANCVEVVAAGARN